MKKENFNKTKRPKKQVYIAKTLRMANYLCNRGLQIIKVEQSEQNPGFYVFLFLDTPKLREYVSDYLDLIYG